MRASTAACFGEVSCFSEASCPSAPVAANINIPTKLNFEIVRIASHDLPFGLPLGPRKPVASYNIKPHRESNFFVGRRVVPSSLFTLLVPRLGV